MTRLEEYKEECKKFFEEKDNVDLLNNSQFKYLFIRAIDKGIPFDAFEELLLTSGVIVNTQQVKDELYLLAIKLLKN